MAYATACMLALSACSADEAPFIADSEVTTKSPIELTVGIVGENAPATRSVVTTDKANNLAVALEKGTSLYLVIKSEDASDANATYSRTIGYAQTQADANNTTVNFADAYKRYWEDSHSRDSRISIYSACVPGYYLEGSKPSDITANGTADDTPWTVGGSTTYDNTWGSDKGSTTITWPLRGASVAHQTADNGFVANQDLCFSNNVSNLGTSRDERITFNTTTKKFNSGRLVFYHALTWVTFKIKKGEGFESTDAFAFSNSNENIVLKGFNTSGTFDITSGEFTSTSNTTDIVELASGTADGDYVYVLDGLMVPGSALTSTATNEVYFTLDDNLYHITKAQLATALDGKTLSDNTTAALATGSTLRPGVHYIFTMTVGKQKVDKLTASVVPWEEVTSEEMTPTNARITVSLLESGTKKTGTADFDLYRATNTSSTIDDSFESYNWATGYTLTNCKAYLNWNSTSQVYEAQKSEDHSVAWYWPDNKTFYHFRTVEPVNHTVSLDASNGDYISLTAAAASSYTDVCWGAPFYKYTENNTTTTAVTSLTYSTDTGFDNTGTYHQISKAIGPTTESINMVMFHMMSDVTIKLKTNDGGSDAVTIAGATVSLSNTYTDGKVLMGNGRVVPGSTVSTAANGTVSQVDATTTYQWHYGFVPQSLENVVLTITTADHNQYKVNMKEVKATTVGNNLITNPYTQSDGKYVIDAWYPNYKYTYTFKLTKAGIAEITATLADWETVEASDDVQIQ